MRSRFAIFAVVLCTLPGCSALLVHGPPGSSPNARRPAAASCTASYAAPVLDAATGGFLLWWGDYRAQDSGDLILTDVGDWMVVAGVFGVVSGMVGWDSVRRCRDFLERAVLPDTTRTEWPVGMAGRERPPIR